MSIERAVESDHLSEADDVMSNESLERKKNPNTFVHNYMEIFKDKKFNPHSLLAPPMELISKTGYTVEEPVLTGAPINFIKIERLQGGKTRKEKTTESQTASGEAVAKPEGLGPMIG
jgi:hypothetical protein